MQRAVRDLLTELSSRAPVHDAHIDNEPTIQDDRKSESDDSSSVTKPRTALVPKDAIEKASIALRPSSPAARELQSLFDAGATNSSLNKISRDEDARPAPLEKDVTKDDDAKTLVRSSKSASSKDAAVKPAPLKEKKAPPKEKLPPIPQNKIPVWGWVALVLLSIFIILMTLLLAREMKRPKAELLHRGQTDSLISG